MTLAALLIIALMVLCNGIFAAYEIALASVAHARLNVLAEQGRRGARAALHMKNNMEASLAVVQLGITLVGAIAAATGGADVDAFLKPVLVQHLHVSSAAAHWIALGLFVLPLSAITIVVGELVPKVFALKNKEWVCLKLSPSMQVLAAVTFPAVWALESLVRALMHWGERHWQPNPKVETSEMQELRAVVTLARTSRLIGGQEEQIILGAARLSSRPIEEIMIPIEQVTTLDLSQSMSESLVHTHTDMHTRFPVCAVPGNKQSIVGYVNFKDIVSQLRLSPHEPSLAGIIRSMPEFSARQSIATCLERLIRDHVHIALVRMQDGRVGGIVTLEDILEELVGDIYDEYDRAPAQIVVGLAGWVVGGGVTLDRLEQVTQSRIDRSGLPTDCRTVHDWLAFRLGRPPRGGDIVRDSGLRVLVRKLRRQFVLEAQVARDSAPPQTYSLPVHQRAMPDG